MRNTNYVEPQLAQSMAAQGLYLDMTALLALCPAVKEVFWSVYDATFSKAAGSTHNHQAWEGGYLDHVIETMNIACKLYVTLDAARPLPFELEDVLEVLWWHDIEKPFKDQIVPYTKENRRKFRDDMLKRHKVKLTAAQTNALHYVEGVPDSEYTPGERTMGQMAAFCHCCDIISARLWFDQGKMPRHGCARW